MHQIHLVASEKVLLTSQIKILLLLIYRNIYLAKNAVEWEGKCSR